jgi:5-methylcytosine-specific restriction protein A
MNKALRPCGQPGCPNLIDIGVDGNRYCPQHSYLNKSNTRDRFAALDRKKSAEEVSFYRSAAWTRTSRLYRKEYPLCAECEARGVVKEADAVHHIISIKTILTNGGNPLSWKNLQSLCHNCHMKHLGK